MTALCSPAREWNISSDNQKLWPQTPVEDVALAVRDTVFMHFFIYLFIYFLVFNSFWRVWEAALAALTCCHSSVWRSHSAAKWNVPGKLRSFLFLCLFCLINQQKKKTWGSETIWHREAESHCNTVLGKQRGVLCMFECKNYFLTNARAISRKTIIKVVKE